MEKTKLTDEEIIEKLGKLEEGWEIDDGFLLTDFEFDNFIQALAFVNQVGELAEESEHHPDIAFGWGYAEIALTTHEVEGLTEADFEMAAKIDKL